MKYFGLLLFAFVLAHGSSAESQNGITPLVMGGINAAPGQFPSTVFIEISSIAFSCGGNIVHVRHVVTAAHCLIQIVNNEPQPIHSGLLRIIAGDVNFIIPTFGRTIRHVSNVFIHPGFNYYSHENDIAVLRLSEPFQFPDNFLEVAVRRQRIVPFNHVCLFGAWGATTASAAGRTMMQNQINVTIGDHDTCNQPHIHGGSVLESMICGNSVGGSSVCDGNDGSGLFCDNQLTGILSFGITCSPTVPGVYTQVRYFNDWLDAQFVRNDTPDATIW